MAIRLRGHCRRVCILFETPRGSISDTSSLNEISTLRLRNVLTSLEKRRQDVFTGLICSSVPVPFSQTTCTKQIKSLTNMGGCGVRGSRRSVCTVQTICRWPGSETTEKNWRKPQIINEILAYCSKCHLFTGIYWARATIYPSLLRNMEALLKNYSFLYRKLNTTCGTVPLTAK